MYTARHPTNEARQPPRPPPPATASQTRLLHSTHFHFQSTLSVLLCSGLAAALDWSSLSQYGCARVTRSVPRRRRRRRPRGSEVIMLRTAWRVLSSIRTQAPLLGPPGGGCARIPSDRWGLPSPPRGEELKHGIAGVGKGFGGDEGQGRTRLGENCRGRLREKGWWVGKK